MAGQTYTTRRTDAGFSLMELLIVISIIALLAGLILGGITVLRGGAQESQARTLLASLMGQSGQLEVSLGPTGVVQHLIALDSTYRWNVNDKARNAPGATGTSDLADNRGVDLAGDDNGDYTYDNGDTNDEYMERAHIYITRFIYAANKQPAIRERLALLGAAYGDFNNDGFMEVVDPWGNPIAYAAGVKHPSPDPLTGTNNYTDDDFLPEYEGPFFASAGKDQRWGRPRSSGEFQNNAAWETYKETDEYKFSLDNLYSFDIDRSEALRGD